MTVRDAAALLMERAGLSDTSPLIPQLKGAGVTWHATKPLEKAGITTFGALIARTDEQLLELAAFGERRRAMVEAALRRLAGEEQ
ncbi:hypothetical protein ACGFJC_47090 [Nonomuraea fuscirosea]|uniref:hypothetical protein n=1 Tax=Nonomuraea fuscirosea TaxID=1291556 RepID=UPI003718C25F